MIERSNVQAVGGAKNSLLLSAHRLIGACLLSYHRGDKCTHLLTRLYGIPATNLVFVHFDPAIPTSSFTEFYSIVFILLIAISSAA